jgi:hypothetical protein
VLQSELYLAVFNIIQTASGQQSTAKLESGIGHLEEAATSEVAARRRSGGESATGRRNLIV